MAMIITAVRVLAQLAERKGIGACFGDEIDTEWAVSNMLQNLLYRYISFFIYLIVVKRYKYRHQAPEIQNAEDAKK
ncbi:uncharacterized protein G2W53_010765 [Senna tora]|uniref:Uncharacterized protein n=1 Tax=Senna tora TaxID=362788 RepID=A0A835CBR9_9FABA|nr:uncharacterized protein G2W53_010765 [Senna tora]